MTQELTVTHSEISKGTRNKRTRRVSGLNGGVITFTTSAQVFDNDVFSLTINDKEHYYRVQEISTIDKETVEVAATEYGYWANYPSRQPDFDVRSLIDLILIKITDTEKLKNLRTSNSYC